MGDRWHEPADPLPGLVEVTGRENSAAELGDDQFVDIGPQRFEKVKSEAVPVLLVGMEDPEPRVETHRGESYPALNCGESVGVVEERVDRISSPAW